MSLEAREGFKPSRTARRAKRMRRSVGLRLRGVARAAGARFASPLTRRIVVLNLGGLAALLIGFLYLNQFREGLIEAKVQSLQIQAEIIAAAIAASATVETDSIAIDPGKAASARLRARATRLPTKPCRRWNFQSIPNALGRFFTGSLANQRQARVPVDRDGYLLLNSRSLTSRSNIMRYDLPPPAQQDPASLWTRIGHGLKRLFGQPGLPLYGDISASAMARAIRKWRGR